VTKMRRRVLSVAGLAFLAPLALIATGLPPASAQNSVTITVGKVKLTDRILVTVPVNIVCAPLPDTAIGDDVSVSIVEAVGKQVSTGSGEVGGGPDSAFGGQPFLTCDGSTNNIVVVSVLPASGSGPFKKGKAIFTIRVTHTTGTCSNGCQETASESGQFGPASVNMR
jgi:hypothetical protein